METTVAAATAGPRHRARAVFAFLLAALVAGLLVPTANAGTWGRYLVDAAAPLPSGARVVEALPVAGAVVVTAPTAPAGAVAADLALGWHSLAPSGDPTGVRLDSAVASTGAAEVWADGTTGERAVVALVDTGVAPVPALEGAVAGEIDFSGTGGGDGYGHGTFLASLIAGRGDVAPGVAPDAGILSLKVAGPDGGTTLGTVLSALEWLHGPGRATGVRVVALALGVEQDNPAAPFLDRAVERLARDGMLVVTAAGNDGPGTAGAPATARGSLSVGSVDDGGTADRGDDVAAGFSATGTDRGGAAQPDLVASGVDVVGSLPADSVIATSHPSAQVEPGLYRGSGTSMSTAVTVGVAALVADARPDLGGQALDAALRAGGDVVDAPAAVAAALDAPGRLHHGADRADDRIRGRVPAGRGRAAALVDPQAIQWRAIQWRAIQWRAIQWRAIQWRAIQWRAIQWRDGSWGGGDWDLSGWEAIQWRNGTWSAPTTTSAAPASADTEMVPWTLAPPRP